MTEEEARAEREEAERLLAEIRRLQNQIEKAIIENQNLQAELASLIENVEIVTENAAAMDIEVNKSMEYVKGHIQEADVSTKELSDLINDLTNSYLLLRI